MIQVLDYAGVFTFALSGATLAIRHRLDVVGVASLALVTGLFGGVLRDFLLGSTPPLALRNPTLLLLPLVAAAVVVLFPTVVDRSKRPVILMDAIGLGLFTVVGANMAAETGLAVGSSAVVGALSASGGGVVRDLLVQRVPEVFTPDSGLYVIPATVGAAIAVIATEYFGPSDGSTLAVVLVGAALGVLLVRLLSVRYGWSTKPIRTKTNV